jgi:hypothetical protein
MMWLRVVFWREHATDGTRTKRRDREMWFGRIVSLLMIGMICVGAIPLIKNTLYPVQRNR